jgi:hypothetical protein
MRTTLVAMLLCACASGPRITQDDLVQRTQALFDAVAPGDKGPWQAAVAEDALYFDEKGRAMDKKALIEDLQPLPPGFSGNIKLVNPKSHIDANVAILSYDLDETEDVFGQHLTARYHATDTWLLRDGKWQLTAGQVLRYYEDPATGVGDTANYPGYAGTYELAPGTQIVVTLESGALYSQRGTRAKEQLIPEAAGIFFRKGVEGRRLFRYGALIDRRNNEDIVWKKVR